MIQESVLVKLEMFMFTRSLDMNLMLTTTMMLIHRNQIVKNEKLLFNLLLWYDEDFEKQVYSFFTKKTLPMNLPGNYFLFDWQNIPIVQSDAKLKIFSVSLHLIVGCFDFDGCDAVE